MSVYGKELIRDESEFAAWARKTTGEILNEGCEDEGEITDMLAASKPNDFPVVGVWVYFRRIHQAFVEWVFPGDFETALPPDGGQTKEGLTGTVNSASPDMEKEKGGAK